MQKSILKVLIFLGLILSVDTKINRATAGFAESCKRRIVSLPVWGRSYHKYTVEGEITPDSSKGPWRLEGFEEVIEQFCEAVELYNNNGGSGGGGSRGTATGSAANKKAKPGKLPEFTHPVKVAKPGELVTGVKPTDLTKQPDNLDEDMVINDLNGQFGRTCQVVFSYDNKIAVDWAKKLIDISNGVNNNKIIVSFTFNKGAYSISKYGWSLLKIRFSLMSSKYANVKEAYKDNWSDPYIPYAAFDPYELAEQAQYSPLIQNAFKEASIHREFCPTR